MQPVLHTPDRDLRHQGINFQQSKPVIFPGLSVTASSVTLANTHIGTGIGKLQKKINDIKYVALA